MNSTRMRTGAMPWRAGIIGLLLALASWFAACSAGEQQGAVSLLYQPVPEETRNIAGSSPAPLPANHQAYSQLTVQAAEHWRDMAVEVAQRVYKAYADRDDLLERPIYLSMPNNRPFTVAFYHLLRTELVSRGLQVSYSKEPRGSLLEYSVQTVPFNDKRFDRYFSFWDESKGSDHEIIVNARLSYHNRFVMHCASIRYINDNDLRLYVDPQAADPLAESVRTIRITRK